MTNKVIVTDNEQDLTVFGRLEKETLMKFFIFHIVFCLDVQDLGQLINMVLEKKI